MTARSLLSQFRHAFRPDIDPEDRAAIAEMFREDNARNGVLLGVLFLVWFGINLVIDILVFLPEGKSYYLYLDLFICAAVTALVVVCARTPSQMLIRRVISVSFVVLCVWAAAISVLGDSPISLILMAFVTLTVLYVPPVASIVGLIAGVLIFLLGATQSTESIVETLALLFWALVVSRMRWASRIRMKIAERALDGVVANQELEIRKRTTDLERVVREREFLLREVHHRVKNNLQVISSLLRLTAEHDSESGLVDTEVRLLAMVLAQEHLYESEFIEQIDLARYLQGVVAGVLHRRRPEDTVRVHASLPECRLPVERAVPLGLVIVELTQWMRTEAAEASISIDGDRYAGRLVILIAGTGLGFHVPPADSLSARLIELSMCQLEGSILYKPRLELTLRLTE